jgi:hypothetical protein
LLSWQVDKTSNSPGSNAADAGDAELGPARGRAETLPHQAQRAPAIALPAPTPAASYLPKAFGGEELPVPFPGLRFGCRIQQCAAVLGDEGEQQPVHNSQ